MPHHLKKLVTFQIVYDVYSTIIIDLLNGN